MAAPWNGACFFLEVMTSAAEIDPESSKRILESIRESERFLSARIRETMPSLPTDLLSVSPEFLDALKTNISPKKKRARIRYIIATALVVVLAVLAADKSAREVATEKGRTIAARVYDRASRKAEPTVTKPSTIEPSATVPQITVPTTAPTSKGVHAPKMVAPLPPKKRLHSSMKARAGFVAMKLSRIE